MLSNQGKRTPKTKRWIKMWRSGYAKKRIHWIRKSNIILTSLLACHPMKGHSTVVQMQSNWDLKRRYQSTDLHSHNLVCWYYTNCVMIDPSTQKPGQRESRYPQKYTTRTINSCKGWINLVHHSWQQWLTAYRIVNVRTSSHFLLDV